MTRLSLFSLAALLLASTAQAQLARHINIFDSGDSLFRRQQDSCDDGYKACDDGGCCRVGEACTKSNDIPICAAICGANVQTCSKGKAEYCCRDARDECDDDSPGYCTRPADGDRGPNGGGFPTADFPFTATTAGSAEATTDGPDLSSMTAPTLESTTASETDTALPRETTSDPSSTGSSDGDDDNSAESTATDEDDAGRRLGGADAGAIGFAGLGLLFGLI